jgi:PAS domain S-box-containing protein
MLVVEDDASIAKEVERVLGKLSYDVMATVTTGEDALRVVAEERPDLVLMEMWLGGELDGIEAAQRIRDEFDLPVVHMTAPDNPAMQKWVSTGAPFTYVGKPIDDRELSTAVESALYRKQMERSLRTSREGVGAALAATFDGIIVADKDGLLIEMNAVACELTEWELEDASGKDWAEVFKSSAPLPSDLAPLPSEARIRASTLTEGDGEIRFAVVLSKTGRRIPVEHRTAPVTGPRGDVEGTVLAFRPLGAMFFCG